MLNLQICQQLKDSGFPQEPRQDVMAEDIGLITEAGGEFYYIFPAEGGCGGMAFTAPSEWKKWKEDPQQHNIENHTRFDFIKVPTLSELIEAVSAGFKILRAPKITCEGDEVGVTCGWIAEWWNEYDEKDKPEHYEAIGITPEESVANLWLALATVNTNA